jgi:transposase
VILDLLVVEVLQQYLLGPACKIRNIGSVKVNCQSVGLPMFCGVTHPSPRSCSISFRAGEGEPDQLAALRNWRVKASEEEIARSLEGNWEEDLLFVLQQEQDGYEFCQKRMAQCDQRLQQYLQQQGRSQGASLPEEKGKERLRKKKKGNAPQFDLRAELFRMTGTDLTQIDGIDVTTTMTILSEAGWDMSKWKTEHHFVSWLRLCPDNKISGDKIIGKGRLPTNNRVTNALRMAASTLRLSNTYLGAQFRRLRTKLGAPVAMKAMAAKLARLVSP